MADKPKTSKSSKANESRYRKPRVRRSREIHGVVYVGHLAEGFNEPQMRQYFEQFGKVKQLRLSRSKKTGRGKGYAFAQFETDEIAKIVAETMNGYSMFKKVMTCHHIPAEKVHPVIFRAAQRTFSKPKAHLLASERHNRVLSERKEEVAAKKLKHKMNQRIKKLNELGVNFTFPAQRNETNESIGETTGSN